MSRAMAFMRGQGRAPLFRNGRALVLSRATISAPGLLYCILAAQLKAPEIAIPSPRGRDAFPPYGLLLAWPLPAPAPVNAYSF